MDLGSIIIRIQADTSGLREIEQAASRISASLGNLVKSLDTLTQAVERNTAAINKSMGDMANNTSQQAKATSQSIEEISKSLFTVSESAKQSGKAMTDAFEGFSSEGIRQSRLAMTGLERFQFGVRDAFSSIRDDATNTAGFVRRLFTDIDFRSEFVGKIQAGMHEASQSLRKMGAEITRMGRAWSKTLTAPLVLLGTAAFEAARQVDAALNIIAIRTGETGYTLAGLQDSFREVGKGSASSLVDVGKVTAELHRRLKIEGDGLESLSAKMLDASRMMDESAQESAVTFAQMARNWEVGADDYDNALEKMFYASQQSGLGLVRLQMTMTGLGPLLRGLGYDFDQATAFITQMYEAGMDTNELSYALRSAFKVLQEKGLDPGYHLPVFIQGIKEATSEMQALTLASDIFGSGMFGGRSMAVMVDAIRKGTLELDRTVGQLRKVEGAIERAKDESWRWDQAWAQFKNQIAITLEPLGRTLMDISKGPLAMFLEKLQQGVDAFNRLDPAKQAALTKTLVAIAAIGPGLLVAGAAVGLIASLLTPQGAIAAGIVGIGLAMLWLGTSGSTTAEKIRFAFEELGHELQIIWWNISKGFLWAMSKALGWVPWLGKIIKDEFKAVSDYVDELNKKGYAMRDRHARYQAIGMGPNDMGFDQMVKKTSADVVRSIERSLGKTLTDADYQIRIPTRAVADIVEAAALGGPDSLEAMLSVLEDDVAKATQALAKKDTVTPKDVESAAARIINSMARDVYMPNSITPVAQKDIVSTTTSKTPVPTLPLLYDWLSQNAFPLFMQRGDVQKRHPNILSDDRGIAVRHLRDAIIKPPDIASVAKDNLYQRLVDSGVTFNQGQKQAFDSAIDKVIALHNNPGVHTDPDLHKALQQYLYDLGNVTATQEGATVKPLKDTIKALFEYMDAQNKALAEPRASTDLGFGGVSGLPMLQMVGGGIGAGQWMPQGTQIASSFATDAPLPMLDAGMPLPLFDTEFIQHKADTMNQIVDAEQQELERRYSHNLRILRDITDTYWWQTATIPGGAMHMAMEEVLDATDNMELDITSMSLAEAIESIIGELELEDAEMKFPLELDPIPDVEKWLEKSPFNDMDAFMELLGIPTELTLYPNLKLDPIIDDAAAWEGMSAYADSLVGELVPAFEIVKQESSILSLSLEGDMEKTLRSFEEMSQDTDSVWQQLVTYATIRWGGVSGTISKTLDKIGSYLPPELRKTIIDPMKKAFASASSDSKKGMEQIADNIMDNLMKTHPALAKTIKRIEEFQKSIEDAPAPVKHALSGIRLAFEELGTAIEKSFGDMASRAIVGFFDDIAAGKKTMGDFRSVMKQFLLDFITMVEIEVLAAKAAGIATAIAQAPATFGASLATIPPIIAEAAAAAVVFEGLKALVRAIPDKGVPQMATGGIVTSPTLALIGEVGPEAVIPLGSSKANAYMGSGYGDITINNNIKVDGNIDDRNMDVLARKVQESTIESLRRMGITPQRAY